MEGMKIFVFLVLILPALIFSQAVWESQIVHFDDNDHLIYVRDQLGNMIPDFSYAGYMNGESAIPDVPVVKTIEPVAGGVQVVLRDFNGPGRYR